MSESIHTARADDDGLPFDVLRGRVSGPHHAHGAAAHQVSAARADRLGWERTLVIRLPSS